MNECDKCKNFKPVDVEPADPNDTIARAIIERNTIIKSLENDPETRRYVNAKSLREQVSIALGDAEKRAKPAPQFDAEKVRRIINEIISDAHNQGYYKRNYPDTWHEERSEYIRNKKNSLLAALGIED